MDFVAVGWIGFVSVVASGLLMLLARRFSSPDSSDLMKQQAGLIAMQNRLDERQDKFTDNLIETEERLRKLIQELEDQLFVQKMEVASLQLMNSRIQNALTVAISHIGILENIIYKADKEPPPRPSILDRHLDAELQQKPRINYGKLRQRIVQRFSLDDLDGLLFDLGVKDGEISGKDKSVMVANMIRYFTRRDKIEDLMEALQKERPGMEWQRNMI